MRRIWMHLALIIVVAGIALFTNLGGPRLWDRDEPRNAGCALEMLQRGDWVIPFFNGELRAHKPALLYWLIMSAYSLFGVNEFAARFWSAVLGMGTALATYGIGRRLFHARVGLWSAVILSTSLMFDVAGRAATPDSTLIFFSTLSLLVYVWGVFRPKVGETGQRNNSLAPVLRGEGGGEGPRNNSLAPVLRGEGRGEGPRNNSLAPVLRGEGRGEGPNSYWFPTRWVVVAGMYALMGLAVLAKGPVGFLLPASVMASFLAIRRFQGRPDFPGLHP
ncbi:MAG: glycosyltransferase family 39 protein, partial [Planctomycetota bacterium]|nr:glycosyltransferase family 39 protein [Planctomycetota bacterium]